MEGNKVSRTDLWNKSLYVHTANSLKRDIHKKGKFFEEITAKVNPKAKYQIIFRTFQIVLKPSLKVSSGDSVG